MAQSEGPYGNRMLSTALYARRTAQARAQAQDGDAQNQSPIGMSPSVATYTESIKRINKGALLENSLKAAKLSIKVSQAMQHAKAENASDLNTVFSDFSKPETQELYLSWKSKSRSPRPEDNPETNDSTVPAPANPGKKPPSGQR